MNKAKKRIGRPTRPPRPGERVTLGLRVTAELKNRIEAAANEKGRSLSQEAEFRLERSFDREELLPEVLTLAYGKPVADVLIETRPQLMKPDVTCKQMREYMEKIFGQDEEETIGTRHQERPRRIGAKENRAKR